MNSLNGTSFSTSEWSRETYFKFYSELEYTEQIYTNYSTLNKLDLEVTVRVYRKVFKQQEILFAG